MYDWMCFVGAISPQVWILVVFWPNCVVTFSSYDSTGEWKGHNVPFYYQLVVLKNLLRVWSGPFVNSVKIDGNGDDIDLDEKEMMLENVLFSFKTLKTLSYTLNPELSATSLHQWISLFPDLYRNRGQLTTLIENVKLSTYLKTYYHSVILLWSQ